MASLFKQLISARQTFVNSSVKQTSQRKSASGKIKTRLTAAGYGYLLLAIMILLMAINYANNLLYVLAYFLISFVIVGILQTRQQLQGIRFNQWHCQPVFAGQNIQYQLLVSKLQGGKWGQISKGLVSSSDQQPINLLAGEAKQITFNVVADKRGVYQPNTVFLSSTYPFGLFNVSIQTPLLPECVVYPAAIGELGLPATIGSDAHQQHEAESITSVRRYVAGDNLSRVAWKSLARRDELMTKEFDGAQGDPILRFDWQQLALPCEARLSQFTRWLVEAQRHGREYSLTLPTQKINAGQGLAHLAECLSALAQYEAAGVND